MIWRGCSWWMYWLVTNHSMRTQHVSIRRALKEHLLILLSRPEIHVHLALSCASNIWDKPEAAWLLGWLDVHSYQFLCGVCSINFSRVMVLWWHWFIVLGKQEKLNLQLLYCLYEFCLLLFMHFVHPHNLPIIHELLTAFPSITSGTCSEPSGLRQTQICTLPTLLLSYLLPVSSPWYWSCASGIFFPWTRKVLLQGILIPTWFLTTSKFSLRYLCS